MTENSKTSEFRKFVSEKELDEIKKTRQEEWEKVRRPDQPIIVPDIPVDNRSLYDRLKEQKDKKQEDFDEQRKFKNQIRGLDGEEAEFLQLVNERQNEIEKERMKEEEEIIEEFHLVESEKVSEKLGIASNITNESKYTTRNPKCDKLSQKTLLIGAIKRKGDTSTDLDSTCKKLKKEDIQRSCVGNRNELEVENTSTVIKNTKEKSSQNIQISNKEKIKGYSNSPDKTSNKPDNLISLTKADSGVGVVMDKMEVIGILPGMGVYSDSEEDGSNGDSSSDSEIDTDLLKRAVISKEIEKAIRSQQQNV